MHSERNKFDNASHVRLSFRSKFNVQLCMNWIELWVSTHLWCNINAFYSFTSVSKFIMKIILTNGIMLLCSVAVTVIAVDKHQTSSSAFGTINKSYAIVSETLSLIRIAWFVLENKANVYNLSNTIWTCFAMDGSTNFIVIIESGFATNQRMQEKVLRPMKNLGSV